MRSIIVLLLTAVVGCAGAPATQPATRSLATAEGTRAPVRFTATIHRSTGTLTFTRVTLDPLGPRLQSVDSINDPSGSDGNPTAADVDLESPSGCTFPAGEFQCEVEMIWGSPTRSLPNPVVQIDEATISGVETSAYDSNNSDGSNLLSLSVDHGLWNYANSTGSPYLTAKGTGYNTGTRMWSFDDPGGADVIYDILVWASLDYSTYSLVADAGASYVNACALGTNDTANVNVNGGYDLASLPFDWTVYDQNYTTDTMQSVAFSVSGELVFGTSYVDFPGPAVDLPNNSYAAPGAWPFWDDMTFTATGSLCYAVSGSAPNRLFVVEWQGMDFNEPPDVGSDLDFEALLHEGSSQIDLVYESMVGAPGDTSNRHKGSEAWVGTQNTDATAAVGRFHATSFGTGTKVTLFPKP
jgi:hypothetical protein